MSIRDRLNRIERAMAQLVQPDDFDSMDDYTFNQHIKKMIRDHPDHDYAAEPFFRGYHGRQLLAETRAAIAKAGREATG